MKNANRTSSSCFAAALALLILGTASLSADDARIARVSVNKLRVIIGQPPLLTFLPVTASAVTARRLTPIAEYGSHAMYEVPAADAQSLVDALAREQYSAEIATDIDEVRFQEYRVDPDTGVVTPDPGGDSSLPAGSDGLFILTLRAYPLQAWLESLERQNVRIIQELEPAAYVVRADRNAPTTLTGSLSFIRGVFPLRPGMKKVGFSPSSTPAAFRAMAVRVVEETPGDDLSGQLAAVSGEPVTRQQHGRLVTYVTRTSELDAEVLTHFSNVYSVGPLPDLSPSAERQGVLAFQTPNGSGALILPPGTSPDYFGSPGSLLNQKGITDFSNTKIAVIDTGFHLGTNIHPDFEDVGSPTIEFCGDTGICFERDEFPFLMNGADDRLHGTLTASVIGGFTDISQRPDAKDVQGYRYSLGLAPKVTLVIDKIFNCGDKGALLRSFNRIRPHSPSVVNMSFNTGGNSVDSDGGPGCRYTQDSADVDMATRMDKWLFTISGGNSPEAGNCAYVRAPGTAKNGITVGATMNHTPRPPIFWDNLPGNLPNICPWNHQPGESYQDARHIPTYSVGRNPNKSLVKPDLVAPATRITGPVGGFTPRCDDDANPSTPTTGIFCNDALPLNPSGPVAYGFSAGTSFAAPAVAGAAAVVRKWHLNVAGWNPSPAMTKAMLINGALDLGPHGVVPAARRLAENTLLPTGNPIGNIPDPYQGWGMLSLTRLLGSRVNYFFYDQGSPLLPSAGVWQKSLNIRDGAKETRVTLVWTDLPSTVGVTVYKAVNNLNLSVARASGGQTWYGNILSSGYSVPNPFPPKLDTANNVEQVILPMNTFASGDGVLVAVDPYSVMAQGQDFALFIDNATEPPTTLQTLTPCRAIDTRDPFGTYGGPALTANSTRTFPLANRCGIPATATAVAVNVTVINGTDAGSLRLFPAGTAPPSAETIYYSAWQLRANNGLIPLAPGANLAARPAQTSGGSVHMVIDVVGYFQQ
jgi:hypothetical protein